MKMLKNLLLIVFLGVFSFNAQADRCHCDDSPVFQGGNGPNFPIPHSIFQGTLTAGFNFSTCSEGTVTFTWDFGDGTTLTTVDPGSYSPQSGTTYATNVNHSYTSTGTYTVCVTIDYYFQHPMPGGYTDVCSNTFCMTIFVDSPCDGNDAAFHILDYTDNRKRFVDISTKNEDSRIVSQTWTVEGNTYSGSFLDYIFSAPGIYDVCYEVIYINEVTGQCCIVETCQTINVSQLPEDCSLDPGFNFSCFSDDCIFRFNGNAGNSNRNIKSWSWDFGDGNTAQGQNPYHTYTNSGTYEVCLTIVGENGGVCCYEEYCRTITFNCTGIDLLTLPNCDNGSVGGLGSGSGHSTRMKAPGSDQAINALSPTINSFKVYPNPASNQLNLELDITEGQNIQIDLIDVSGKRISLKDNLIINEGVSNTSLEVGNLAPGVYTLSITGENFFENKRVIIK